MHAYSSIIEGHNKDTSKTATSIIFTKTCNITWCQKRHQEIKKQVFLKLTETYTENNRCTSNRKYIKDSSAGNYNRQS